MIYNVNIYIYIYYVNINIYTIYVRIYIFWMYSESLWCTIKREVSL